MALVDTHGYIVGYIKKAEGKSRKVREIRCLWHATAIVSFTSVQHSEDRGCCIVYLQMASLSSAFNWDENPSCLLTVEAGNCAGVGTGRDFPITIIIWEKESVRRSLLTKMALLLTERL